MDTKKSGPKAAQKNSRAQYTGPALDPLAAACGLYAADRAACRFHARRMVEARA